MPRLGGEYFDPRADGPLPVQHARLVFLDRVRHVVPAVLESLRDDVLPLYREAWAAAPDRRQWWDPAGIGSLGRPAYPPQLEAGLRAWAERWHLTDAWLLNDALATLHEWAGLLAPSPAFLNLPARTLPEPLTWHADHWSSVEPEEPEPLTLRWNPLAETWVGFRSRADAALDDLRARGASWAAEHGFLPSPEKPAPRRTDDAGLHFEWLALYQCAGWPRKRIARHYGRAYHESNRTAPAISDALSETARLIGLTRR
jgi:hypothetical protein